MYFKWLQERGVMDEYSAIKGSQEHHIKVNKFKHKYKATYYQLHPGLSIKSITWMLQNEKVNDQGRIQKLKQTPDTWN
jgi:hypothetical protein